MAALIEEAGRFYSYYNLIYLGQAFLFTILLSFVGCGIGFVLGADPGFRDKALE